MRVLVINNAEPKDSDFNQPLVDLVKQMTEARDTVNYTNMPKAKKIERNYGAVILSGVPLDYDFDVADRRLPHYKWIKHTSLPVMGICLGHQIIGRLFGAELIRNDETENGVLDTFVANDDPIFAGVGRKFDSFLMHRASIPAPKDFDILARSERCQNIIMKHQQKPIYGLQMHPELSPRGADMIRNFVNITATLDSEPDEMVFGSPVLEPDAQTALA